MAYNIDVVKTNVPEALEILVDSVVNPKFLTWEVNAAINKMREDIKTVKDNPQTVLLEVWATSQAVVYHCHCIHMHAACPFKGMSRQLPSAPVPVCLRGLAECGDMSDHYSMPVCHRHSTCTPDITSAVMRGLQVLQSRLLYCARVSALMM